MSDSAPPSAQAAALPTAIVLPARRSRWWWMLLPAIALVVVLWLGIAAWRDRGERITVRFAQGHGVKAGDLLRYRGIAVGEVESVALSRDLAGIEVALRLRSDAAGLATQGARFWVMRPQVGLGGVSGLDTLVGNRYVAVLPGAGEAQRHFVGLEREPILDTLQAGGLGIVLQAATRGSLQPGSPVLFRQVVVGRVTSVDLASDASSVEAHAYIEPPYRHLVCTGTRFWNVTGIHFEAGLSGISLGTESVEALLNGGVAFATPDLSGPPAPAGARFAVADRADAAWLAWRPDLRPAAPVDPSALPALRRALLRYSTGKLWTSTTERSAWAVPLRSGWLLPAELAQPPSEAHAGSTSVSLDGTAISPTSAPQLLANNRLALLPMSVSEGLPGERLRTAGNPEDVLVVGDPARPPLRLSASRLAAAGQGTWQADDSLNWDVSWHGSAVLGERDKALIGVLVVTPGGWTSRAQAQVVLVGDIGAQGQPTR